MLAFTLSGVGQRKGPYLTWISAGPFRFLGGQKQGGQGRGNHNSPGETFQPRHENLCLPFSRELALLEEGFISLLKITCFYSDTLISLCLRATYWP